MMKWNMQAMEESCIIMSESTVLRVQTIGQYYKHFTNLTSSIIMLSAV